MSFKDKCAVITGGGGGFGNTFARALTGQGANVVLADVNPDTVEAAAQEVNGLGGGKALPMVCDVTSADSVEATMEAALSRFGSLDILINNAGGSLNVPKESIDQISEADWDLVIAVNLKGTFLCTRAAAGPMKKAGQGRIVNLSSITARAGGQLTPVQYVSAKGAIISFTRHVAQELGPHGICVNAVAPGLVLTPRLNQMWLERKTEQERQDYLKNVPLGRLGTPRDIADAVLFLCSDQAQFITGLTLDVNGGMYSV